MVDLYFAQVVALRVVKPATARRAVSALQWQADKDEYLGERVRFVVDDSQCVKDALRAQERLYNQHLENSIEDPHDKLPTDTLSRQDSRRVISTVLAESRANWQPLCICWMGSEAMMLRNASMRKFTLPDLLTILDTHTPRDDGPFDRQMLALVYRPGTKHKERQKKKRVVGSWRHKDYVQCFTGMVAMSLFIRLYANATLNFRTGQGENHPPAWYNIMLVEGWTSQSAAYEAYSEIMAYLRISWEKVTHLRKASTERASRKLVPFEIKSMTKHATRGGNNGESSRFDESYMTELHPATLNVMSGFEKNETYFIPRTRVDIQDYCRQHGKEPADLIFPRRNLWLQEKLSVGGDDSKAASNFLHETLPFLAKVVIQDGIYWIHDFPNHTASRHLLHVMPADYPQFARNARAWAHQQHLGLGAHQMTAMQTQTQQAFHTVNHRFSTFENQFSSLRNDVQQVLALLQQKDGTANGTANGNNGGGYGGGKDNGNGELFSCAGGPPPSPIRRFVGWVAGKVQGGEKELQEHPEQVQQVQKLRSVPHIPPFPTGMPKSWADLQVQHSAYHLEKHTTAHKTHWPDNVRNAYSKRVYLFNHLVATANRMHGPAPLGTKLPLAAARLDAQRDGVSMNKVLRQLKSVDPAKRKRNRNKP